MRISDVLRVKGTQVVTVTPDTTVRQLLAVLAEHRIGAVVVSHDGTAVDGIASERDIARALARRGAAVMSEPVDCHLHSRGAYGDAADPDRGGHAHDDGTPGAARAGRG